MTETSDHDTLAARVQELEEFLHLNHEVYVKPFGLTQQQAKLLALLMESPVVSAGTIKLRTGMVTEAKVIAHRLRARLKAHDVSISAKRSYGFWLEPEEKEKVRAITSGGN
jgi:hypothetical protein